MKILDRYLIREMTPAFVSGILVFTFVILMSQFLRLVEMIVNKGVGVTPALRLILYLVPSILVMTVPMAMLLGVLSAFGRLSADNEITALKSGGVSLFRLVLPVILYAVGAALLTFWLVTVALPAGNQSFRTLMFEIVRGKASLGLQERVFNDEFDGLIIYVNEIPVAVNPVMKGIIIHDSRADNEQPRREPVTIYAEEGRLITDEQSGDVVFRLKNGSIHSFGKDRLTYDQIGFDVHDLRLTMAAGVAADISLPKGLREMTLGELRRKVEEYRRQNLPVWPPLVEIHKKYAIPFACIVFAFMGVSLGVIFRKGEKMVAFALCGGVVIVYYVFLVAGEPMGKQGVLPPWLSMWGANIFFGLLGAALFTAASLEKHAPASLLAALRGSLRRRPEAR